METGTARPGSLPLLAGALALNFANTASGRGSAHQVEHLRTIEDLLKWARHANVVKVHTLTRIQETFGKGTAGSRRLLRRARALREAIHRIASALASNRGPTSGDLRLVREGVSRAIAVAELVASERRYVWRIPPDAPQAEALLGPIALSAAEVLQKGDLARVKCCPGDDCGWVFLDTTKNNTRRWCDMAVCGNRAKVRRFAENARRRGGPGERKITQR